MKRWGSILLAGLLIALFARTRADFAFAQKGYDPFTNTYVSVLSGGSDGGLTFEQVGSSGYRVSDGQSTLRWQAEAPCEEGFQAFAMPRSLDEVREMNRVMACLNDEPCVERQDRAAYLEEGASEVGVWEIPLTLILREDANLTDDPYGSCRGMKALGAGERVTCLGYFDALWALVETRVEGKDVRGFIPLRALAAPQEAPLDDVAARLAGRWLFYSGGELLGMAVEFCEKGTLITYDGDGAAGNPVPYAVYAAPAGRYPEGVPYVLELTYEDGSIARYGFTLTNEAQFGGEGLGLYKGYFGGGYYREGQTLPQREDGDWG